MYESPFVKTPDVKCPDVKTADVKTADVKTPDVKTADVKTADVKTADVKTPDVKSPFEKTPDVKTPDVTCPDLKTPEVKTQLIVIGLNDVVFTGSCLSLRIILAGWRHIKIANTSFRSVVVITFALHAKGPRFETGRKLSFFSSWSQRE